MKSDQLSAAQTGVQAIHVLSVWLLVAVLVLYGLAIYLARGATAGDAPQRRPRARARRAHHSRHPAPARQLPRRLSSPLPGYQPATHRLYLIGTAILGQIGAAAVLYGLIAALGAVFAGPSVARGLAAPEARSQS